METGNKKRKLPNTEKTPKFSYGLSRSMIGQQQPQKSAPSSSLNGSNQSNVEKVKKSETNEKVKSPKGQGCQLNDSKKNKEVEREKIVPPEISPPQSQQSRGGSPVTDESSSDSIQFPVSATQVGALLFTPQSKVIHISGVCTLRLLSGKGNINGYRLRIGEEISVRSPPWVPAIRLFFEATTPNEEFSKKRFVNELIQSRPYLRPSQQEITKKLTSSSSSPCTGIVEIVSADMIAENWIIRCEDFSKYQLPLPPACPPPTTSAIFLSTAIVGNSSDLSQLGLDSQHLPTDWVIAGDLVCKSMKTCPRAVLLGAKGVGKSTSLRYLINRILSKNPFVAVLDCDLGQPEFTPSGLVSLHILTKQDPQSTNSCTIPLLSPPHLHLHKPQLSFYLGDLSMKNLPEIFEQCLLALYSKYLLYADYYQTTGRLPLHSEDEDEITPEKLLELSHTSNFHLLAHDSESEEIQFPLPLIVNTDGLIRGIGVEIQRIILQTVKPTHILHLQNEKDKILAPIEEMREQHQQQLQKQSEENADGTENRLKKLQISLLTPGRTTASRLSAQDLRDLRMVSYFLSRSNYLDQITTPSSPSSPIPSPTPVNIRSGVCRDPLGHIPTALLHSLEDSLPISRSCFHLIGSNIPPRLILAAFNIAIVGISTAPFPSAALSSSSMSSRPSFGYNTCHLQIPTEVISMITPSHDSSLTTHNSGINRFYLNYAMNQTSVHLLPCKGLGIVSDVDLLQSLVHLITPEDLPTDSIAFSTSSGNPFSSMVHLSRGSMQLPPLLTYNDNGQVCAPYHCSENFGEGSASLSARTNLKRRSHGK